MISSGAATVARVPPAMCGARASQKETWSGIGSGVRGRVRGRDRGALRVRVRGSVRVRVRGRGRGSEP